MTPSPVFSRLKKFIFSTSNFSFLFSFPPLYPSSSLFVCACQRITFAVVPQESSILFFEPASFTGTQCSQFRLGSMASKPQAVTCLCFPSIGIINVPPCPGLMWEMPVSPMLLWLTHKLGLSKSGKAMGNWKQVLIVHSCLVQQRPIKSRVRKASSTMQGSNLKNKSPIQMPCH